MIMLITIAEVGLFPDHDIAVYLLLTFVCLLTGILFSFPGGAHKAGGDVETVCPQAGIASALYPRGPRTIPPTL